MHDARIRKKRVKPSLKEPSDKQKAAFRDKSVVVDDGDFERNKTLTKLLAAAAIAHQCL